MRRPSSGSSWRTNNPCSVSVRIQRSAVVARTDALCRCFGCQKMLSMFPENQNGGFIPPARFCLRHPLFFLLAPFRSLPSLGATSASRRSILELSAGKVGRNTLRLALQAGNGLLKRCTPAAWRRSCKQGVCLVENGAEEAHQRFASCIQIRADGLLSHGHSTSLMGSEPPISSHRLQKSYPKRRKIPLALPARRLGYFR
jgi:hypothetical protein